ncbi:MAG: terminase small subunit [Clostridia bacterium]|nr:terminase small subunit [Clostridia bacterium]
MEDEKVKEYDKLTEKQKRFIDFYIETANATESAKRAGYSEKTAKNIGAENLTKLNFFIQERLQQLENNRIASADEVLKYFTKVMRGEEKDQFGLDAALKDRNFAAKCLAQRHGLLIDKKEVSGGYTVELVDDVNE